MSEERRGSLFLGIVGKVLGLLLAILGILIAYYSYNTPVSIIDPRIIAPLGVFLIALGGFMLLAKVK
jgi:hypothetical protein